MTLNRVITIVLEHNKSSQKEVRKKETVNIELNMLSFVSSIYVNLFL